MKRIALCLIISLALSSVGFGAVAKNDSGTAVASIDVAATQLDLTTFTVSAGSNLCLIAILVVDHAASGIALSWDSGGTPQSLTSDINSDANGVHVVIAHLIAQTTGNKTLTATWGGSNSTGILGAIAFSGADQTTCTSAGHTVNGSGSSATPSTGAITSSADGATVGAVGTPDAYLTGTTTQTAIFRTSGTGGYGNGASYALGGASNTHTWSAGGSVNYAYAGVHVLAASGGGGGGNGSRLTLLGVGR